MGTETDKSRMMTEQIAQAHNETPADETPAELVLRVMTMPADLNGAGSIFGGWIMARLDQAAGLAGGSASSGNVTTVAVKELLFLHPVYPHQDVKVYARLLRTGRTSMHFHLEMWAADLGKAESIQCATATFVVVAVDAKGKPRFC
ncbi:acyl-CoA thioesterase [Komagataeibacter saccharivorans]|nr:acyl-CoA thioesterase [Komagataeibacter saccharivorans]